MEKNQDGRLIKILLGEDRDTPHLPEKKPFHQRKQCNLKYIKYMLINVKSNTLKNPFQ